MSLRGRSCPSPEAISRQFGDCFVGKNKNPPRNDIKTKVNMSEISRRDFLKLARDGFLTLSGALAFVGFLRFLDYDPNPAPKTKFDLGSAEKFPPGSRTVLPEIPAILIHTESGFFALSLVCTHLGCTLDLDADGFACPCHNSRFDADGKVTHGPATKYLQSLRVEVTAENNLKVFTV
jgi:cytochrome b6-f complex iron-sulfur subunit